MQENCLICTGGKVRVNEKQRLGAQATYSKINPGQMLQINRQDTKGGQCSNLENLVLQYLIKSISKKFALYPVN